MGGAILASVGMTSNATPSPTTTQASTSRSVPVHESLILDYPFAPRRGRTIRFSCVARRPWGYQRGFGAPRLLQPVVGRPAWEDWSSFMGITAAQPPLGRAEVAHTSLATLRKPLIRRHIEATACPHHHPATPPPRRHPPASRARPGTRPPCSTAPAARHAAPRPPARSHSAPAPPPWPLLDQAPATRRSAGCRVGADLDHHEPSSAPHHAQAKPSPASRAPFWSSWRTFDSTPLPPSRATHMLRVRPTSRFTGPARSTWPKPKSLLRGLRCNR
jgi:hypothetical protein